ncbi:histone [Corynebacterium aquatimens]|uniref:histone n=1 Tax=Corynebacterium TaxID=1716 RepID=UPI001F1CCD2E|nr:MULTISPECIES: histone [Corynebacterium]QYH19252.1 histone [Corynebacterium aquatimens]UIZ91857.1 histone [Corynebacterium sp. CNCTC7651]
MPPKITDSRPAHDAIVEMEEQTASGARRIVATYAEDFHDGVTLMSMLGVEPKGFVYKRYNEQREADLAAASEGTEAEAPAKKTTKKAAKKTAKKATKSTAKKATKKAAKKTTKKTTKKATKSTAKKAAKKTTAKKATTTEE